MKVGEVSAPVKSQFGYHIIKLEEIQAGEAKPFADVRAELDSQYRQDHAADLFGERQEQMAARIEKGVTDLDARQGTRSHARLRPGIPARRRRRAARLERRAPADRVQRCHAQPGQDRRPGPARRRSPRAR